MPRTKQPKDESKENLREGSLLKSPKGSLFEITISKHCTKTGRSVYEIEFIRGTRHITSSTTYTAEELKDCVILRVGKTDGIYITWVEQKRRMLAGL